MSEQRKFESHEQHHWIALVSGAIAAGATLKVGVDYANKYLRSKDLKDKYTIPMVRLEDTSQLGVAMRKVVAAVLQKPNGSDRDDIQRVLRLELVLAKMKHTDAQDAVEATRWTLRHLSEAVTETRANGILLPAISGKPELGLTVSPDFAEFAISEPYLLPNFIEQCDAYRTLMNDGQPDSTRSTLVQLQGLLQPNA